MTEQLKEALSAVVDGEADVFELRRVLDEVGRSPALADAWQRYHLIGEHLRGEPIALDTAGLSDQRNAMADAVWDSALAAGPATGTDSAVGYDDDSAPAAEAARKTALFSVVNEPTAAAGTGGALKKWAPIAVAASVAMMVLVGFNSLGGNTGGSAKPEVADNISIEGPVYQLTTEVSPSDVRRASAYMLHHVQQKALNNPGVVSFVKVATYERSE
ncbi:MAG: sigma-E factor negative regulatory protein [Pseudomonadales bacterium]